MTFDLTAPLERARHMDRARWLLDGHPIGVLPLEWVATTLDREDGQPAGMGLVGVREAISAGEIIRLDGGPVPLVYEAEVLGVASPGEVETASDAVEAVAEVTWGSTPLELVMLLELLGYPGWLASLVNEPGRVQQLALYADAPGLSEAVECCASILYGVPSPWTVREVRGMLRRLHGQVWQFRPRPGLAVPRQYTLMGWLLAVGAGR